MNTWNTIKPVRRTKIQKATFILETVCQRLSIEIIESLKTCEESSLIDLIIRTGLEGDDLEKQLELLSMLGVVNQRTHLYTNYYALNYKKLAKISAIAFQLNQRRA